MKYYSFNNPILFQKKPVFQTNSKFFPKSWTASITSYLYMANKLRSCLWQNLQISTKSYRWFLTVYFWREMTAKEIVDLWAKISRKLNQKGIVAFWIREPTKTNKVHYHLLVVNNISQKDLEKIVEESFPLRSSVGGWHKKIEPITNAWNLLGYLVKAKIPGTVKGKSVIDRYGKKRILFQPNTGIRKHGVIGNFWVLPMEKLWKRIQEKEKKIGNALADPKALKFGTELYRQLLFSLPKMSEKRALRTFALTVDHLEPQQWIQTFEKTGELFSW